MSDTFPEMGGWDDDASQFWEQISRDYGDMFTDPQAAMLFDRGWIVEGYSPEQRGERRDEFFDYAIEQGFFDDEGNFDWDAFKEYMGYGEDA